jgi:hypothetical protein
MHVIESVPPIFKVGDRVVKNPKMWIASEFDKWGAGHGIGEVVDLLSGNDIDVRWPSGRCLQRYFELLPAP